MMDGRIWVTSQAGRGSTFHFTARFATGRREPAQAQEARPPQPPQERGLRVLLVEDNLVNRILATELLQKRGHETRTADNGQEALELLRRESFDLVLMDVRMPVMDGLEATRRIRNGEAGDPRVPIVALTAHALTGDQERLLAAGMSDYLAKPFNLEDLDRVLARTVQAGPRTD